MFGSKFVEIRVGNYAQRNFALHGYCFRKKNIELIKSYEKYAEDYRYDFGR